MFICFEKNPILFPNKVTFNTLTECNEAGESFKKRFIALLPRNIATTPIYLIDQVKNYFLVAHVAPGWKNGKC